MLPGENLVPLESVLCTEELNRRPTRPPDYALENRALVALAQALADSPHTILQTLTEKILEHLEVGSAGVSLLSDDEQSFFWPAIAGAWQPHLGSGTPRSFGPCNDVLDRDAPLLFKHPERRYADFLATTPAAEECLLVPFHIEGKAVGTIWAIAHDDLRKFDAEDLRLLESLGRFGAAAYQAQTLNAAEQRRAGLRLEDAVESGQALEKLNAELRESEEAVRRSEGELRDFVEHAAIGLQWVGVGGIVLWANQTDLDLLGYTREEYLGHHITEFYADQPVIEDILARLTGGETLLDYEARLRCKDGSIRHVLISSNAFFENGKFVRSRCFTRDITGHKRAEEVLRKSEEGHRLALDTAELGTFHIDPANHTFTTDERFQAIFGTPAERIDYKQAFAIVHPEDRAELRDAIAAATRSDDPVPYFTEYRVIHPDGTIRWVFAKGRANFVQEGSVRKLLSFDGTVADITERKQAEASLRESEAFNRSIIESSPDCIKVLNLQGDLQSMLSGGELLGIEDIRPFLNKSWFEFWHGEDRRAARTAVAAATAGGKGQFVGFFRTLRGEPKWWDVSISPILEANGKTVRLLAVSRDVTQRKWAEMNLEFLASVSQDLVCLTSVDEVMRTVGAKIALYLELSLCAFVEVSEAAEQVVIAHDWHRQDVPSLVGVHRLADFVGAEFIRVARTGELIVVCDTAADSRTAPERFAAMKIASFVCVPLIRDDQWRFALCLYHSAPYNWRKDEIDLTRELTVRIWTRLERLHAEAELRESENRYRTLFNSIDEGFCIIEKVGGEAGEPLDFRYIEANPAFEAQSGARNVVGRTIRQEFPGISEDWYLTYDTVLRTGEPIRFERGLLPAERVLELYVFRVEDETHRRVAIIFKDITERNRLEGKTREQAEALADLDRRKDEFLAMLGHELRNPLAPISNALRLLRLQKNEDPIQQRAYGVIERQVGQLTYLVDDLLEISRINTGRVHLRQERIVIGGIVERAVETAHPLIAQRRHELTVSLPPQPIWLHADAARLEQVMVNLLTNAAKYTDDGGHIWLTVQQEGDVALLRVRDTGVGISPELLPRIFDLFTQAERSLDRSQGGLGIGLCLVQRLVELHGGTVAANSVLGQGSEFVVRLPIMLTSPTLSPVLFTHPVPSSEKLCDVLVVDDNVDAAQSLAMLLEMLGHEVRMAFDGPSALEAALDQRPDMVLLDIGLPGLNGFEVAQRIRRQPQHKDIVLVAMTGYGQEADRKRSSEAGFDHHLAKPADFDKLQKILATVSKKATVTTPP